MPINSYNNTTACYKNQIAIVGNQLSSLYFYDVDTDFYFVNKDLSLSYKIVSEYNNVLFVLTPTQLLVLDNEIWNTFPQQVGGIFSSNYSYHVYNNGFIYIAVPECTVLRLNVTTKEVEVVTTSLE